MSERELQLRNTGQTMHDAASANSPRLSISIYQCISMVLSRHLEPGRAQHAAGGLAGLVFAMLMEAVLLIIRTTVPYELPPKRRKGPPALAARLQDADQQSTGAEEKVTRGPGAPSRRRGARRDLAASNGAKKDQ